jgi:hypothetical protein
MLTLLNPTINPQDGSQAYQLFVYCSFLKRMISWSHDLVDDGW